MKKVYGTYLNSTDAQEAIEELKNKAYNEEDIKLISSSKYNQDLDLSKNDKKLLESYKKNIEAGELVVLIKRETPDWDEREKEFYEDLEE